MRNDCYCLDTCRETHLRPKHIRRLPRGLGAARLLRLPLTSRTYIEPHCSPFELPAMAIASPVNGAAKFYGHAYAAHLLK